jgi:hypothetical protein
MVKRWYENTMIHGLGTELAYFFPLVQSKTRRQRKGVRVVFRL